MNVTIPYGKEKVELYIPDKNFVEVLSPQEVISESNSEQIIKDAIENPIGSKKLEGIIKPGSTVNIICDDISRPTPCHKILPVLLKKLDDIGIEKRHIKVVMALGSHRYMTKDEMIKKVGENVYSEYRVVNSEFKKKEDLLNFGKSADGVEVFVSKEAVDSDFRIGVGNIVPHPSMGWSGGGKILYPGVTGEKTVMQFHIMAALYDENMFGMDECPVRLNVEKWVDIIGLDFIINTVLTSKLEIYKAVAGHYVKAQRKGVEYSKEVFGRKVKEKVDIMIASSYPCDIDFWQSGKAIFSADKGLKDNNGTIILVSPNYEGIGPHPEYAEFCGMDDAEKTLIKLKNDNDVKGDPLAIAVGTAVSKLRKRRDEIIVVGDGIKREEVEASGMTHYYIEDIQKAVDYAISKYNNPKVSVITHGGELAVY